MGEIQVTIPQTIRERCGLLPHTEVHVNTNVILDVVTGDPRWSDWLCL
jgi:hypothetical protein